MSDTRLDTYRDAINTVRRSARARWSGDIAEACMAVADAEQAALSAEIERQKAGRAIEQTMLTNALPRLAALDRVWALIHNTYGAVSIADIRAALEEPKAATSESESQSRRASMGWEAEW